MDREYFITKSNNKHNFKYNYTDTIVTKHSDIVKINCAQHGDFLQKAAHHIRGNGCPDCGQAIRTKKRTNSHSKVIDRFRQIHGDAYDYSKSVYKGMHTNIEIICKYHGSFNQQPNVHIGHKSGCPTCANEKCRDTVHEFISKSQSIHGDTYIYEKVYYVNNNTNVMIECKKHGPFYSLPQNHLRGSGCPTCGYEKRIESHTHPLSDIIIKANHAHNGKYVYDWSNYKNTSSKVKITCPTHGTFIQKISNHIFTKQGCPLCGRMGRYSTEFFEKIENRKIDGKLYLLRFALNDEEFLKIGITKRKINDRWYYDYGFNITEEFILDTTIYKAFLTEQFMLNEYLYKIRQTPTLKIGGDRECFKTTKYPIDWLIRQIEMFHNSLS